MGASPSIRPRGGGSEIDMVRPPADAHARSPQPLFRSTYPRVIGGIHARVRRGVCRRCRCARRHGPTAEWGRKEVTTSPAFQSASVARADLRSAPRSPFGIFGNARTRAMSDTARHEIDRASSLLCWTGSLRIPPPMTRPGRGRASVECLAAHPFLPLVAAAVRGGRILVWDTDSHVCIGDWMAHDRFEPWCLQFDPSGRRLAVGWNNTWASVWDWAVTDPLNTNIARPTCVVSIRTTGGTDTSSLLWNPDGTQLAIASSPGLVLDMWNETTKDVISVPRPFGYADMGTIHSMASHPRQSRFVTAHETGTVCVRGWDTDGQPRVRWTAHADSVRSVTANADWIVTGGYDRACRVWAWPVITRDAAHPITCVRVLDDHAVSPSWFDSMSWAQDASVLVNVFANGTMGVWSTTPQSDPSAWVRSTSIPTRCTCWRSVAPVASSASSSASSASTFVTVGASAGAAVVVWSAIPGVDTIAAPSSDAAAGASADFTPVSDSEEARSMDSGIGKRSRSL